MRWLDRTFSGYLKMNEIKDKKISICFFHLYAQIITTPEKVWKADWHHYRYYVIHLLHIAVFWWVQWRHFLGGCIIFIMTLSGLNVNSQFHTKPWTFDDDVKLCNETNSGFYDILSVVKLVTVKYRKLIEKFPCKGNVGYDWWHVTLWGTSNT